MNPKVSYWLEMADYDLETARVMLQTKRLLYVGFMCHQTIEKVLKACWVQRQDETPPYLHNLRLLASKCGIYDEFSDQQKDTIDLLAPLNIEARYPTHKEKLLLSLTPEKCQELLRQTEELYQWIRNRLSNA